VLPSSKKELPAEGKPEVMAIAGNIKNDHPV
jgi:hypothetical protein